MDWIINQQEIKKPQHSAAFFVRLKTLKINAYRKQQSSYREQR